VLSNEALIFEAIVFLFSFHIRVRDERCLIASRLEDATEQTGDIMKCCPGSLSDAGNRFVSHVCVWAGEIENEVNGLSHGDTPSD